MRSTFITFYLQQLPQMHKLNLFPLISVEFEQKD